MRVVIRQAAQYFFFSLSLSLPFIIIISFLPWKVVKHKFEQKSHAGSGDYYEVSSWSSCFGIVAVNIVGF